LLNAAQLDAMEPGQYQVIGSHDGDEDELNPCPYDLVSQERLVVSKVVGTLEELASLRLGAATTRTAFEVPQLSAVRLEDYVTKRLSPYMKCSVECFVMALLFIERVRRRHADFRVSALNVNGLMLAGLVVAAKAQDDAFRSNEYYAHIGGVSELVLFQMEIQLMKLMGWSAHVTVKEFNQVCDLMFSACRVKHLCERLLPSSSDACVYLPSQPHVDRLACKALDSLAPASSELDTDATSTCCGCQNSVADICDGSDTDSNAMGGKVFGQDDDHRTHVTCSAGG